MRNIMAFFGSLAVKQLTHSVEVLRASSEEVPFLVYLDSFDGSIIKQFYCDDSDKYSRQLRESRITQTRSITVSAGRNWSERYLQFMEYFMDT
ncbi:hypothetical protein OUZ56_013556 [Daphnia magna]|uniref:Uncharacterized protein n=1 Tax=Daphnia magna TaxID=35525 RepID=A0ABQ9Z6A4_9CRUS|nr:hypothetical protein OUZ56_013556 [Daphnia magna]